MVRHRIAATAHCTASRSDTWSRLADVANWATWGPWKSATVERGGNGPDTVLGTVWTLRSAAATRAGGDGYARFEVVASDTDRTFGFELWSGLPLYSCRIEIGLYTAADGGTYLVCETDVDVEPGAAALLTRAAISDYICACLGRLVLSLERGSDLDAAHALESLSA